MVRERTNGGAGAPWTEYRELVLAELERLDEDANSHDKKMMEYFDTIRNHIQEIKAEIAVLQVKAGVWGAAAGVITMLVLYLTTKIKLI